MYSRSNQSLAFEAFWRSLRGPRLVPDRGDFRHRQAAQFLPNIVLLEAPGEHRASLHIRLAGQTLQDDVPYRLVGTDILDFYPAQHRCAAVESGRLMMRTPCGLWQITPVHHSAGFARPVEVTAFPLSSIADGIPLVMVHLLHLETLLPAACAPVSNIAADTALEFRFLDIGRGEPRWPLAA